MKGITTATFLSFRQEMIETSATRRRSACRRCHNITSDADVAMKGMDMGPKYRSHIA
ncbi:hypothetical protein [Pleomorphochaeta sp. DL1XJH-081]|jgi:hypothetical protein|uniref:hypothetical protein n=1 Tax=Pleomorphochaeta sp. DL1XJH-081 TaxID=3409690 RepID=UPI003BB6AADF